MITAQLGVPTAYVTEIYDLQSVLPDQMARQSGFLCPMTTQNFLIDSMV